MNGKKAKRARREAAQQAPRPKQSGLARRDLGGRIADAMGQIDIDAILNNPDAPEGLTREEVLAMQRALQGELREGNLNVGAMNPLDLVDPATGRTLADSY